MKLHALLPQHRFAGKKIFLPAIASLGDGVRVLAEQQGVADGTAFARGNYALLQGIPFRPANQTESDDRTRTHRRAPAHAGANSCAGDGLQFICGLLRVISLVEHQNLNVNLQTAHRGKRVAHGFPDRGMRVHHVHHIVDGAFEVEHRGGLRQDFRGQRADDVNAQNFAKSFVGNDFNEATVISQDGGLAVTEEWKLASLDLVAGGDGFFFRQANRTDLRLAIGGVGNARAQERVRGLSRDVGYRDNAFHHGRVCQLRHSGNDIPDGVQPRLVGFAGGPYVHEAAIEFGLGFLQAAIFRHGFAAHGQQQFLGLQSLRFAVLVLEAYGDAGGVFFYAVDFAAGKNLDIFLAERFLEFRGNFLVFHGNDAIERFEDGHLRAEGIINRGKFDANGACSNDNQRFRNRGKLQDGTIGQDGFVVRLDTRK